MPTAGALLDRKGREVATISPGHTVLEAARVMNDLRIGSLVVVGEDGSIEGILSERDILTRVVAMDRPAERTSVQSVMTRDVVVAGEGTSLDQIRAMMRSRRIRHVPVVRGGRLSGMISIGDLNAETREALCATISTLESYIRQG